MEEIMEQIPPWFTRSGIYTLLLVIGIILLSGYLIPYDESLEVKVERTLHPSPFIIKAPFNGEIDKVLISDSGMIEADSKILSLTGSHSVQSQTQSVTINTPFSGTCFISPTLKTGSFVDSGQWMVTIIPEEIRDIRFKSLINKSESRQIETGMKAILYFNGKSESSDLKGSISEITGIVGSDRVEVEYELFTTSGEKINNDSLYSASKYGIAKIITKESRLINHIIEPSNPLSKLDKNKY